MNQSPYAERKALHNGRLTIVSRGVRAADGTPVVLKRLRQLYPPPASITALRRELALTRQAACAGVVEALELSEAQGVVSLVFKDFGGTSLAARLQAGRLPLAEAVDIAVSVCDTLAQVHERGMVHRDVNPSNIVRNGATGEVRLIDFGLATTLSRQTATATAVGQLMGTLRYLAPEQSGRTEGQVDARSDLYALGVTLYEMLTGRVPFETDDALGLVHAHIALVPSPPCEVDPQVPRILSDVVMRLLQKRPDLRYQTARGVWRDLQAVAERLNAGAGPEPFPLGQFDLSDRLRLPEQLYGRRRDIGALTGGFQRAASGGREILLIAGQPGIGKSSLVTQVQPAILECRGIFLQGKFDQFNQGVPFEGLVLAIKGWVAELAGEEEGTLSLWRQRLAEALGNNGAVLTALVPELRLLIVDPPPVADMQPAEAHNRLMQTMRRFVKALAAPAHPLVLFLDDLQWACPPSIELIVSLATDDQTRHVLLLGAFRDNEVDEGHPLTRAMVELKAKGVAARSISLGPLADRDVAQFLADALSADIDTLGELATVVSRKTGGNPFFVRRFLCDLNERGLVSPDPSGGPWRWDLAAIRALDLTDNVVGLICTSLSGLPEDTRRALQAASIIGNQFGLSLLAEVLGLGTGEAQRALRPALDADLITVLGDTYWEDASDASTDYQYRFQHDRIQQAADSLMTPAERCATHLQLAHRLMQLRTEGDRADLLFRLVEHLHQAGPPADAAARAQSIQLHTQAGLQALASAAFAPAHILLDRAMVLAGTSYWTEDYLGALSLTIQAARAAYLTGHNDRMKEHVAMVQRRARRVFDRAQARIVEVQSSVSSLDLDGAISLGLETLGTLGYNLPWHPTQEEIGQGLQATLERLASEPGSSLAERPVSEAAEANFALQLQTLMSAPAFVARPALLPILAFDMVRITLDQGPSRDSPFGFGLLGLFLCAIGMYDAAYAQAQTTLALLDRFEDCPQRARATHLAVGFVAPWKQALREVIDRQMQVYYLGMESGDLEYACWGSGMASANALWAGVPLDQVRAKVDADVAACLSCGQQTVLPVAQLYQAGVIALCGDGLEPTRLVHAGFDEDMALPRYHAIGNRTAIAVARSMHTMLRYLFGDDAGALQAAAEGMAHADGVLATYVTVNTRFYGALAALSHCDSASDETRAELLATVAQHRAAFEPWIAACADNHAHRLALIDAELARVNGDAVAAMNGYDHAIRLAAAQGFLQDEALASELAGRFHLKAQRATVARAYLTEARYAYEKWGAHAKVTQLLAAFPDLATPMATLADLPASADPLQASVHGTLTGTVSGGSVSLDLDIVTMAKAMQAITSESDVDALLTRIVQVAMESAGATSATLLLAQDGGLVVAAECHAAPMQEAYLDQPLASLTHISRSVVTRVFRSGEAVVSGLDKAPPGQTQDGVPGQAVAAVVLADQGRRLGVLYLSNDLIHTAFPPSRVLTLELLASQAAIALGKARLLRESTEMVRAFERFVPKAFLGHLGRERVVDIALGDARMHQTTVMFTDLRGFTSLFEKIPPREGFALLNLYLGRMTPIIEQHGGLVDKFIGDGIMALFLGSADQAVKALLAMHTALGELNDSGELPDGLRLRMGAGLHAGPVALGTVGSAQRLDVTALGDTVNSASRLEAITSAVGAEVLISEDVMWRLLDPNAIDLRVLGQVLVYGREEPIAIVEVFSSNPEPVRVAKRETAQDFEAALEAYRDAKFAKSIDLLTRCLARCPQDEVARRVLDRAKSRASGAAAPLRKGEVELV
ncbi:MAG: AAA family ATPase [Betaproteobacteria bacterium]